MNALRLPECAAVFLAVAGMLTWLAYAAGDALPQSLLTVFRWELEWLMGDFSVDYLDLQEQHGETVVLLRATLLDDRIVFGRLVPPGASISASTLALHAWMHPILMFSLLAAWPGMPLAQKPLLLLIGLPFVLLAEMLDIPLILSGAVEDMLYWQAGAGMANPPLASSIQHVLDGGGRYGISLLFTLLAVSLHRALAGRSAA